MVIAYCYVLADPEHIGFCPYVASSGPIAVKPGAKDAEARAKSIYWGQTSGEGIFFQG